MIEVHFAISTLGKKRRARALPRGKVQVPKTGFTVRSSGWQEIIIGFMLSQKCGELSGVIRMFYIRTQSGSLPWLYFFWKTESRFGLEEYMEKKTIFTGVATALITPFNEEGMVDYTNLAKIIDYQLEGGVDALVTCGTTGEPSTMTDDEHREVIEFTVKYVNGRVPVIAGCGSNDTGYALDLCKCACESGADAMLVVTPYYNKATQKGMIASFNAIADASTKPCILYNVPSRTGCNLLPESVLELSKHPNIVGIKEASGNISQVAEIAALVGDEFDIYSGNDDQIVPILSLGGVGVISVLSNIMPKATSDMCDLYFEGKIEESRRLQLKLLPLVNALFSEVNPIPVKAAVSAMGYGENYLRLPLTPMEKKNEDKLLALMKEQNLI